MSDDPRASEADIRELLALADTKGRNYLQQGRYSYLAATRGVALSREVLALRAVAKAARDVCLSWDYNPAQVDRAAIALLGAALVEVGYLTEEQAP